MFRKMLIWFRDKMNKEMAGAAYGTATSRCDRD